MSTAPQKPNVDAQRTAMNKLGFLVGRWSGEALVLRGPGLYLDLDQTEEAQFQLDGLVLMIEGVGRTRPDGKAALQALGLISFDDASGSYRIRAFNDGRWLESAVEVFDESRAISWGFAVGEISTKSILRINDKGEWTELAKLTIGTRPPQKLIELTVRR